MKSPSTSGKKRASEEAAAVKAYLAALPKDVATELRKLSKTIRAAAPKAKPGFSYGVPAFRLNGRPLVWFAAFENHSSFFPGGAAIRKHSAELKSYKISKGTIRFTPDKPLPPSLVAKLVKARMADMQKPGR